MVCLLDDPECAPKNDSEKPDKEPSHAQDGAEISKVRWPMRTWPRSPVSTSSIFGTVRRRRLHSNEKGRRDRFSPR